MIRVADYIMDQLYENGKAIFLWLQEEVHYF